MIRLYLLIFLSFSLSSIQVLGAQAIDEKTHKDKEREKEAFYKRMKERQALIDKLQAKHDQQKKEKASFIKSNSKQMKELRVKTAIKEAAESLDEVPTLNSVETSKVKCGYQILHNNKPVLFLYDHVKQLERQNGPVYIKEYILDSPYPTFDSTDAASLFFASFVEKNFDKKTFEFCTDFYQEDGKIVFKKITRGTPFSCPKAEINKNNLAGGIHTHPGDAQHLDHTFQTPSGSDYAVTVYDDKPHYMAGPAGQILKYDKTMIECRGSKQYPMIRLRFEEIKGPKKRIGEYDISKNFRMMDNNEKSHLNTLCPKLR